ncbi:hypothetical protein [Nonomuraea sp. NPDC049480]
MGEPDPAFGEWRISRDHKLRADGRELAESTQLLLAVEVEHTGE